MSVSRRRFLFGAAAVAVPAIIGIDGVMKFFTPAPEPLWVGDPLAWQLLHDGTQDHLIVPPDFKKTLDPEALRKIIQPALEREFGRFYSDLESLVEQRGSALARLAYRRKELSIDVLDPDRVAARQAWRDPGRVVFPIRGSYVTPAIAQVERRTPKPEPEDL
jgi:hypothetical protein